MKPRPCPLAWPGPPTTALPLVGAGGGPVWPLGCLRAASCRSRGGSARVSPVVGTRPPCACSPLHGNALPALRRKRFPPEAKWGASMTVSLRLSPLPRHPAKAGAGEGDRAYLASLPVTTQCRRLCKAWPLIKWSFLICILEIQLIFLNHPNGTRRNLRIYLSKDQVISFVIVKEKS